MRKLNRRKSNHQLNHPARILVFTLMLAVAIGVCFKPLAQSAPDDLRQRARRVNSAPTETALAAQQDDDEVVRVNTDLANILLTAIDKDRRFVTTLRREDLRVTENGAAQEISIFQRETDLPLSLAILIDTSRSQERTLPEEKRAALAFVDTVIRPEKDTAALISFNGEATIEQPLTNEVARLHGVIDRVRVELPPDNPQCKDDVGATPVDEDARCWTNVWDSIWATIEEALAQTPERTRRAIILLSDGDDTGSKTKRQQAIERAVKANVVVYSIGIGDPDLYKLDKGALRKLSEQTGGRAFFPQDEAELRAAFAQIQDELRSQYLVAYSPTNKERDGSYRQVRIEVVNPQLRKQKLSLLYRQGYYAMKASKR
ncbi:MAG TPA: VWA domain-containing protein [Pyrinomonadaceae bacterium]